MNGVCPRSYRGPLFIFLIVWASFAFSDHHESHSSQLNHYLKKRFDLEAKTADLEQAQVIILGDHNHTDHQARLRRIRLMNLLVLATRDQNQRTNILFSEEIHHTYSIHTSQMHLDPVYKIILPEIILGGWSDDQIVEKGKRWPLKILETYNDLVNIQTQLKTYQELQQYAASEISCPSAGKEQVSMEELRLVTEIISHFEEESSVQQKRMHRLTQKYEKAVIGERNKRMIANIELALATDPLARIFIDAGMGHFDSKRLQDLNDPSADVLRYLEAKTISYAFYSSHQNLAAGEIERINEEYVKELAEDALKIAPCFSFWDQCVPLHMSEQKDHQLLMQSIRAYPHHHSLSLTKNE